MRGVLGVSMIRVSKELSRSGLQKDLVNLVGVLTYICNCYLYLLGELDGGFPMFMLILRNSGSTSAAVNVIYTPESCGELRK